MPAAEPETGPLRWRPTRPHWATGGWSWSRCGSPRTRRPRSWRLPGPGPGPGRPARADPDGMALVGGPLLVLRLDHAPAVSPRVAQRGKRALGVPLGLEHRLLWPSAPGRRRPGCGAPRGRRSGCAARRRARRPGRERVRGDAVRRVPVVEALVVVVELPQLAGAVRAGGQGGDDRLDVAAGSTASKGVAGQDVRLGRRPGSRRPRS